MAGETVVLNVRGMTCAGCVQRVTRALSVVPGVIGTKVVLLDQRAVVECEVGKTDAAAMREALRRAGFKAA